MARREKNIPGKIREGLPRKSVPAAAARPLAVIMPPSGRLTIRWTRFDFGGPFCLTRSDIHTVAKMMQQCSHIESMAPMEIFRPNGPGKDYGDPADLPNAAAVDRLREIGLQDETNISRLQFSGKQRLYGFRRELEFYAVFWDPEHEIWPSKLKHT